MRLADKERLVQDIYHRGVITCRPDDSLLEVVRVMADTEVHAVIVSDREGQLPVGIVSHTDILPHYGEDLAKIRARDAMTSGLVSISEQATVCEAARSLLENGFSRLLVVSEDGRALGILSTTDVVREMRDTYRTWCLD